METATVEAAPPRRLAPRRLSPLAPPLPHHQNSNRGVDLEQLLELKTDDMVALLPARQRRRCVFFFVFFLFDRRRARPAGPMSRGGRGPSSCFAPPRAPAGRPCPAVSPLLCA